MTLSVEELAEGALQQMTQWKLLRGADRTAGDREAAEVLRRSLLGGMFPTVDWDIVDHNYPQCQEIDHQRGLVVVTQAGGISDIHFVLTVHVPWRKESPSEVWIASPQAVADERRGHVADWLQPQLSRVTCLADVDRWIQAQRPAAAA